MTGAKHTRPGFTLIEMLIVVLIFSIASAILSDIFMHITRLQRKVSNMAVMNQDMRFATELMVRAARSNYIDYSSAPLPAKSNDLLLDMPSGGTIEITIKDSATCNDPMLGPTGRCLMLSTDGGATWNVLTSHRVNVTNFDVYVLPSESPFTTSGVNQQPVVTLNIGLQYMADNPQDRTALHAQTTVSSRLYQR